MTTLKSIALAASTALVLTFSLANTGCKDDSSCEAAVDHTIKLLPKEFADAAKSDKASMIKKCEAMPEAGRKCILAAKDLEGLAECKKHEG